jgi:hypothetical protein
MGDIAFLTLDEVLTLHADAIAFAGGSPNRRQASPASGRSRRCPVQLQRIHYLL